MLVGSNLNPYKKLLEAGKKKDYEYYKNLMESLYDFLDKECEHYDNYVTTPEYLNETYLQELCLEWIYYDIKNLDYSYFIEEYKDTIRYGEDIITDEVVDNFIKENFRFSYDTKQKELDSEFEIIFEDDNEEDYLILGKLSPGLQELLSEDYDTNNIKIKGKRNKKNIISLIKEIPDDIFEELIKESGIENLPIYDVKEELIKVKNEDSENFNLTYIELGDHYTSYSVGIKKNIFEEHFIQYLKDNRLLGIRSEDNSVWEEEE